MQTTEAGPGGSLEQGTYLTYVLNEAATQDIEIVIHSRGDLPDKHVRKLLFVFLVARTSRRSTLGAAGYFNTSSDAALETVRAIQT
ncbi:MAG TPA: hypothetical protein QGF35_08095 [Dehalococcoidia bacterium]|nr:hypothetical protein [Dehalococcoidia bacterium]